MSKSTSDDDHEMDVESNPPDAPDAPESGFRIRIPNPSLYMERQSQWKGRRGKPRCDFCRAGNLRVSARYIPLLQRRSYFGAVR